MEAGGWRGSKALCPGGRQIFWGIPSSGFWKILMTSSQTQLQIIIEVGFSARHSGHFELKSVHVVLNMLFSSLRAVKPSEGRVSIQM